MPREKNLEHTIFSTEKDAIDFAKRYKLKKKHDCRIKEYDYKYFNGVTKLTSEYL